MLKNFRNSPIYYPSDVVISSAQNHEDVLLNRLFMGKRNGSYIDIGAGDPNWDSVTNWFYRIGWTGINIDPNPMFENTYAIYRPKDINLTLGISTSPLLLTYYKVKQDGLGHGWRLSSFDPAAKERATKLGFDVEEIQVETVTLQTIVDRHVSKEIDFLKIDVEGFEKQVLLSVSFERFRPQVVLIESVLPNSAQPSHAEWEHLLTDNRYIFALFDGVNNYYIREESIDIVSQLNAAVNCNDRFRRIEDKDITI